MSYQELSAAGENRFDHLVDVENKTAQEAWEVLEREQIESLGAAALLVTIEEPEDARSEKRKPKRIYAVPHADNDSAYDPEWNVPPAPIGDRAFVESQKAFREFAQAAHIATIESNAKIEKLTPTEAAARMRLAEERRQSA